VGLEKDGENCTHLVNNEEVLRRVNRGRKILHKIKGRKADWICYVFRKNCLLKHVIEEKIEGIGRRGRR
jgi:hypothetical protein